MPDLPPFSPSVELLGEDVLPREPCYARTAWIIQKYQPVSFPIGSLDRIQGYQIHLEQDSGTMDNSEVAALSAEEPEEF